MGHTLPVAGTSRSVRESPASALRVDAGGCARTWHGVARDAIFNMGKMPMPLCRRQLEMHPSPASPELFSEPRRPRRGCSHATGVASQSENETCPDRRGATGLTSAAVPRSGGLSACGVISTADELHYGRLGKRPPRPQPSTGRCTATGRPPYPGFKFSRIAQQCFLHENPWPSLVLASSGASPPTTR